MAFMIDDLWWGLRLHAGRIETDSGTTHATISTERSVAYIEEVFRDYKHYGELDNFRGTIAEVGPGDNAGVALLMRKDGCEHVDLIDRYLSRRDTRKQSAIYDALSRKHQLDWLKRDPEWNEAHLLGIAQRIGQPAEEYFCDCAQHKVLAYDVIVSRSVLEHLFDPLKVIESMISCLKSGGRMVHKVDLRDHGMFTPEHHEFMFLHFPGRLYRYMTRNSGRPNRVLFHRYRAVLERLRKSTPIVYSLYVTRLAGVGDLIPHQLQEQINDDIWHHATCHVEQYRKGFAAEFRDVESRDLAVTGFMLIIIKP